MSKNRYKLKKQYKDMKIREQIEKMRIFRGLTQAQLAEKTGLTQAQISNFESGKTSMTSENLDKVISVLDLKFNLMPELVWTMAEDAAKSLIEKGITNMSTIEKFSRDELAAITGNDEILTLRDVSESSALIKSGKVSEKETFDYFMILLKIHIALQK